MVVVLRMKFCACKFGVARLEIGINVFPGVGNFVVRHPREVNVVVNAWTSHQVQKKCEWGKKWKHYKELILNNSFSFLLTVSVKIIFKKTFFCLTVLSLYEWKNFKWIKNWAFPFLRHSFIRNFFSPSFFPAPFFVERDFFLEWRHFREVLGQNKLLFFIFFFLTFSPPL